MSEKEQKRKYSYPFIECSHHKGPQRSYCVCMCVFSGTKVPTSIALATDQSAGVVCCAKCAVELKKELNEEATKLFACACEGCVIDRGFLITA